MEQKVLERRGTFSKAGTFLENFLVDCGYRGIIHARYYMNGLRNKLEAAGVCNHDEYLEVVKDYKCLLFEDGQWRKIKDKRGLPKNGKTEVIFLEEVNHIFCQSFQVQTVQDFGLGQIEDEIIKKKIAMHIASCDVCMWSLSPVF